MKSLIAFVRRNPRDLVLNVTIMFLTAVVGYLAYSFVVRHVIRPPVEVVRDGDAGRAVIQIDVLNGSGIPGAASECTAYLRSRGYDVVEMRNYKRNDVRESLVIDRTGSLENARRVAYALGVPAKNIVQQINEDYYVDVSVLVGRDFRSLKPSEEGGAQ